MLTIKLLKSTSADGAGGGVPAYLKAAEYYLNSDGKEQSSSLWLGRGAQALGLSGSVDEKTMDRLADGFGPKGEKLRQNAGSKPQWRPTLDRQGNPRLDKNGKPMGTWVGDRIGFDLTFSAPKSFSIAFALADPKLRDKMLEAHHRAVERGLETMERQAAETRRGKGGKDHIEVEGLVISRHTHYAARSHDKGPDGAGDGIDPQVHSHCLVYNSCIGKDGKWGTLESSEMYAWEMTVGALYRAELAEGLRELGFGIEDDIRLDPKTGQVKNRFWKLAGIPDDLADERSGRRKQILDYMEQHPTASAQEANLATRAGKDEPTFGELIERWGHEFEAYRQLHPEQNLPRDMHEILGRSQEREPVDQAKQDREILNDLHETKSVWSRRDLIRALAERSAGRLDAAAIENEASAFLGRHDLALIKPEAIHKDDKGKKLARRHRKVRFADRSVVEAEKRIVREAVGRKDDQSAKLDPKVVDKAIADMEAERGFKLSQEQSDAVRFTTVEIGGVAIMDGRAGTGKTTAADAIVKAFEASGRHVIGCATAWDAAKKLEAESGIESHSIASLNSQVEKGKVRLNRQSVILVDEAGMVGTPSLDKLLSHAHKAGAKVLLQGDRLQLQSVERGGPLRLLAKELGSAQLKQIRRQRHKADRDTADMFYAVGDDSLRSRRENLERGNKILERMEQRGQLQGYESKEQASEFLVADYMASPRPDREKLIIAGTRADVAELNQRVRDARRAKGELGAEHSITVEHARTGVQEQLALAEGDRIRFGKKHDGLGVVNGTRAVVDKLTPTDGGYTIEATIQSDIQEQDGRKIQFSTKDYAVLDHAYASTVHKAQGQGREEVYHLGHKGMTDRQLSLVAFTRAKSSYAIYGAAADLYDRGLDAKIAEDRLQTNALTEGLVGKTTQQVIRERQEAKRRERVFQHLEANRRKPSIRPEERQAQRSLAQRAGQALQQLMKRVRARKPIQREKERQKERGMSL